LYQQFKCIINLRISDYYVCGVGVDQATKLRRVMTEEKFSLTYIVIPKDLHDLDFQVTDKAEPYLTSPE